MSTTVGASRVHEFLTAIATGDPGVVMPHLAPEFVFEAPFIEVRADRAEFEHSILRTVRNMKGLAFTDLQVDALAEGDCYVATYRGSATMGSSGKPYEQRYFSRFDFTDDGLVRFTENFDPSKFRAALKRD